MPRRSTIGINPLAALSEEAPRPRTAPAPLTPSPAAGPTDRALSAWAGWPAASIQAAMELHSGLLQATLVSLDSFRRSYDILAQHWSSLTREAQEAMLDAFWTGPSPSRPGRTNRHS